MELVGWLIHPEFVILVYAMCLNKRHTLSYWRTISKFVDLRI
jgi:hypothetical protein